MTTTGSKPARLALHSTHEAAAKIAGIGAVLDGILPEPAYQAAFDRTLMVGAYHFPAEGSPLARPATWRVAFDSAGEPCGDGDLRPETRDALQAVAEHYGTRIVFGGRCVGTGARRAWVDVLLARPQGIRRAAIEEFRRGVEAEFGFDLPTYEAFPAIKPGVDLTLERILRCDPAMATHIPNLPLVDVAGEWVPGGIHFVEERADFPAIAALDSFQDFLRQNHYLIELQFYLYSAPPLWDAARALIETEWGLAAEQVTLFAHDWIGVPLYWAMRLDRRAPALAPRSVYFAHEARIARLLVEGVLHDQRENLKAVCHPDGHDVSFYAYLRRLLSTPGESVDLAEAFPGTGGFKGVYYHVLNSQAVHFDQVLAVGEHVLHETDLVCRGLGQSPCLALCPNGVPDLDCDTDQVANANARLKNFAEHHLQFRPDYIFTSVNRAELSKAPWRNVGFFRAFARANSDKKALFIWLVRPHPLPTDEQIAHWATYGWPLAHRSRPDGGDLRRDEVALWQSIETLNAEFAGRYHILYVNQFGWDRDRLGRLDPLATEFCDLRTGTDVELGLSIYEPFGIAELEPFSSGAVCVQSDACGCAAHLSLLHRQGLVPADGFVVGRFTEHDVDPATVDLTRYAEIEEEVYRQMVEDLLAKLAVDRSERLTSARRAMQHLSWAATVTEYFLPAVH